MEHARDLMEPAAIVRPDLSLPDLARELSAVGAEAVCVVEEDRLVGVVTGMDLVYREKRVHPPAVITLFDLVLPIGRARTEREIEKVSAITVRELMTTEVVSAGPETPIDELATLMVERHVSMVPIVDGHRLVGVVTRRAMVDLALRHLTGA